MKLSTLSIVLFVVCGAYMIQQTEAIWGGYYGYRPFWGFRPFFRPYFSYYNYYWGWPRYYYNPYVWRRSVDTPPTRMECSYMESTSMLSCASPSGAIQCETLRVFDSSVTKPFQFFAIGAEYIGNSTVDPTQVYYSLYPEQLEKKEWLNSTFIDTVTSKTYTYGLFHSSEYTFSGFRVKSLDCWRNITTWLSEIKPNETISVPVTPGKLDDIKILGGVLLS